MVEDEPRAATPQDASEAKRRPQPHARVDAGEKKAHAPGIDEHESGGQGLSG